MLLSWPLCRQPLDIWAEDEQSCCVLDPLNTLCLQVNRRMVACSERQSLILRMLRLVNLQVRVRSTVTDLKQPHLNPLTPESTLTASPQVTSCSHRGARYTNTAGKYAVITFPACKHAWECKGWAATHLIVMIAVVSAAIVIFRPAHPAAHQPQADSSRSLCSRVTLSSWHCKCLCVFVAAGQSRDEEPRLPETQEDPGGTEHR